MSDTGSTMKTKAVKQPPIAEDTGSAKGWGGGPNSHVGTAKLAELHKVHKNRGNNYE